MKKQVTNQSPRTKADFRLEENGIVNDIHESAHEGLTYSHKYGKHTGQILELNKKIRNDGGTTEKGLGLAAMQIPPYDYHVLLPITHPELFVNDRELRLKAWKAFCNHPDGRQYLLNDKKQKYFNGISNELRPAKNAS